MVQLHTLRDLHRLPDHEARLAGPRTRRLWRTSLLDKALDVEVPHGVPADARL